MIDQRRNPWRGSCGARKKPQDWALQAPGCRSFARHGHHLSLMNRLHSARLCLGERLAPPWGSGRQYCVSYRWTVCVCHLSVHLTRVLCLIRFRAPGGLLSCLITLKGGGVLRAGPCHPLQTGSFLKAGSGLLLPSSQNHTRAPPPTHLHVRARAHTRTHVQYRALPAGGAVHRATSSTGVAFRLSPSVSATDLGQPRGGGV